MKKKEKEEEKNFQDCFSASFFLFFFALCREYVGRSRLSTYLWPTFRSSERLALLPVKIDENCFSIRFTSLIYHHVTRIGAFFLFFLFFFYAERQRSKRSSLPYPFHIRETKRRRKRRRRRKRKSKRRESKRWKATAAL